MSSHHRTFCEIFSEPAQNERSGRPDHHRPADHRASRPAAASAVGPVAGRRQGL